MDQEFFDTANGCTSSYEEQCGLTTLETRHLRGDQIEVFKIFNVL